MAEKRKVRRHKVVTVISLNVYSGQSKLNGMIRFFNERHAWDLDIRYGNGWITADSLRQAAKDGVEGIILLSYPSAKTIRMVVESRIPCVIETSERTRCEPTGNLVRIICDANDLSHKAALHLMARQTFTSFGYVNTPEEEAWSRDRGEFFRQAIEERWHVCSVFFPKRGDLQKWLKGLAKPAAVCAANDETARMVIAACSRAEFKVPNEVAVLGIDDDPTFCLDGVPSISSVVQDFAKCGYLAAEALEKMMNGERNVPHLIQYGASGVSTRESTLSASPHVALIQKAFEYIDANACRGIGAEQVADHLGVSRRLIDLRFRELQQQSIHEVLRERKLEEVKRLLLTTDTTILEITKICGFANKTHLKNLFRRCYGMSMRQFRMSSTHPDTRLENS